MSLARLSDVTVWFGLAVAGMMIVFVGLAVDAYRHNHNAAEESLLSLGNPGHLLAAIGLAITSVSVLVGMSIAALRDATTREHVIRRFAGITAAWVGLAVIAVSAVTYIGSTGVTVGHVHDTGTTALAAPAADNGSGLDATGVSSALQSQGIITSDGTAAGSGRSPGSASGAAAPAGGPPGGTDPSQVQGALTQGADGKGGHVHDHGQQPTFAQIESMPDSQVLSLFPANTVAAADYATLKGQIEQVRQVALKFPTVEAAAAGGYVRTTSDVPYMGEHYLNFDYVKDGVFDPSKPEGLLFSKIDDGPEKLVGVWFLLVPGIGNVTKDVEPQGFASALDLWHAHLGLCLVGLSTASEGETKASCQAKGGAYTADLRWMMHVWVSPAEDNPAGVFAYLNADLYAKQVKAGNPGLPVQNGSIAP